MKRTFVLFAILLCGINFSQAASKKEVPGAVWSNPQDQKEFVVHGQAWSEELRGTYWRFPERTKNDQRKEVWGLSQHSAGVHLRLKTDAKQLYVRYIPSRVAMDHFPATGLAGMDLYARNSKGEWRYCMGRRQTSIKANDTVVYNFSIRTPKGWRDADTEFYLYFPLYAMTKWCEVGVLKGNTLTYVPKSDEKPVVLFGCSVDQGGCASRPGMAWSNIASRVIDEPIFNFGFSGNGRFEASVVNLVSEIDAKMFIFNCVGNMGGLGEEGIRKNIHEGIRILRQKSDAPILILERFTGTAVHSREDSRWQSDLLKVIYKELQDAGIKNLHYMTSEEVNMPLDGTVDGIHPNDYGMKVIGDAVGAKLKTILESL